MTEEVAKQERYFERLTLNQRVQHIILIVSFSLLVITGLPLRYSGSAASSEIISFLGGFGMRSILHRVAAIILIGITGYHTLFTLFTRIGLLEFMAFMPEKKDIHDLIHVLKFYVGLAPDKPKFDRYNYIEKFEYLAVGWGSVAMITTGALLWSPSFTLAVFPKWVMDIALVIHSWEAILAFLAIIIWHMYNVHFNPSVFPMSRVWLTGKIGLHELKENHPLEYDRIMARQGRPAGSAAVSGKTPDATDDAAEVDPR